MTVRRNRSAALGTLFCAILVLLAPARPSHAGWEYTEWTMVAQEVVEASSGQAQHLDEVDTTQSGLLRAAEGVHQVDIFEFSVSFFFREQDQLLDLVVLVLTNTDSSGQLFEALRNHFGEPLDEEIKPIPGGESHWAVWEDEENNNKIEYRGGIDGEIYVISYAPRTRGAF